MIGYDELVQRFIRNEGCELMPYKDTEGYWTIGIGRCFEKNPLTAEEKRICGDYMHGITKNAAFYLLRNDVEKAIKECRKVIPFFESLDNERQYALVDMCFQLGPKGLAGFKKMIAAMGVGNWEEAYRQCLDSTYAHQTPVRAKRIAYTIKCGKFLVNPPEERKE